MSSLRIAINGFGRIGRGVLRALYTSGYRQNIEVVAINELADLNTIAHLLKYDSVHGRFDAEVSQQENQLTISYQNVQGSIRESIQDNIRVSHHQDIRDFDVRDLDVDVLLECSGAIDAQDILSWKQAMGNLRVLYSRPMRRNEVDATIVYGVNQQLLNEAVPKPIISAGSCTTNAIVPVIHALDQGFGVEQGSSTTIHSMMNDQPVLDAYHHTNLRKTRAASHSMIPVNTELAKGVGRILPHLSGRFTANAVRVPTLNVSAIDLVLQLKQSSNVTQVHECLYNASQAYANNVLALTNEPLASCDFNQRVESAIIDAAQTRVSGGHLLKVWVWFDNEWAFAHRMLDISQLLAEQTAS